MRDLFSFSCLERMRSLYDLNPTGDYSDFFIEYSMHGDQLAIYIAIKQSNEIKQGL